MTHELPPGTTPITFQNANGRISWTVVDGVGGWWTHLFSDNTRKNVDIVGLSESAHHFSESHSSPYYLNFNEYAAGLAGHNQILLRGGEPENIGSISGGDREDWFFINEDFDSNVEIKDLKGVTRVIFEGRFEADSVAFNADRSAVIITFTGDSGNERTITVYLLHVTFQIGKLGGNTSANQLVENYGEGFVVNQKPTFVDADNNVIGDLSVNVAEGETAVATVRATDPDGDALTYTIDMSNDGIGDGALFEIDESTGVLTFKAAPDFENPQDIGRGSISAGRDNLYDVYILASDGFGYLHRDRLHIKVFVTNVNEAPVLENNNPLAYNADETLVVLKPVHLLVSDVDNANAEIIFTALSAPEYGILKLDGAAVGIRGTFTMADVIAGKVTYAPGSSPRDDVISFTYSDGTFTSGTLTFRFDVRARTEITQTEEETEAQTVTLDLSEETAAQEVITDDDSQDEIKDGAGDDYIETGTGDDVIELKEDGGDDTIAYNFDGSGDELVGTDGSTRVSGFTRGEDKILFKTEDTSTITTLDAFLKDGQGTPDDDFADDKFIITVDFDIVADPENPEQYVVLFSGITFHFRESAVYGGNKLSMPIFEIAFDEPLLVDELLEAVGGRENLDPLRGVALKKLVELDDDGNVIENYVANILGADSIDFTQEAAPDVV